MTVSNCGTLDCSEKQPEKEVEIYKPICEDIGAKLQNNSADTYNKGKTLFVYRNEKKTEFLLFITIKSHSTLGKKKYLKIFISVSFLLYT